MEYPPQALPEVLLLSVPLLLFMHHWFLTAAGVTAVVDAVAGQTRLPCPASVSLGLCFHVGWGRQDGGRGGVLLPLRLLDWQVLPLQVVEAMLQVTPRLESSHCWPCCSPEARVVRITSLASTMFSGATGSAIVRG